MIAFLPASRVNWKSISPPPSPSPFGCNILQSPMLALSESQPTCLHSNRPSRSQKHSEQRNNNWKKKAKLCCPSCNHWAFPESSGKQLSLQGQTQQSTASSCYQKALRTCFFLFGFFSWLWVVISCCDVSWFTNQTISYHIVQVHCSGTCLQLRHLVRHATISLTRHSTEAIKKTNPVTNSLGALWMAKLLDLCDASFVNESLGS